MANVDEENFLHLATCISRMHSALETLRIIKASSPENPLIPPAFRFALVEYASAFTRSDGQLKKYILDDKYVPPQHLDLHKRIVTARHQVHAHTDLKIRNATFNTTGTKTNPSVEVRGTHIDELKELPNIDQIIDLLNESINIMYVASEIQLKALSS
ncbi:MAG: hypothetical protein ACXU8A_02200 [Burkholderiaceae bacterium]